MTSTPTTELPTILFGVTSSQSLKLLGQIPQRMVALGWDVHVVSDGHSSGGAPDFTGVRVHSLAMIRQPSLLKDIQSFFGWLLLLRRVKPTMVVIGTPKAALLGLVAATLCGVPVRVYQLRGLRLQTVSGFSRGVLYFFEWLTAKSATEIAAVSHSLMEEYFKLGLSPLPKLRVVGYGSSHGVDTEHFNPHRWSHWQAPQRELRKAVKSQKTILGFVGRFSADKGGRELLSCRKALSDAGIDHELLIIGPLEGDEELLEELMTPEPGAIITGPVPDVAPYYTTMHALLLPTHREGFPNVVLEAAATQVPAITTTATGAIDSVVDGETGLIAPLGDPEALAEAVKGLLADDELRLQLGRNARKRVLEQFREQTVSENYAKYLKNLVESTRNTH